MARATDVDVTFRVKPGDQQVDTAAVSQIPRSPGVRKDLRRRARNVADYQKAHVGRKSGKLRGTIRVVEGGNLRGQAASVQVLVGRAGITYTSHHIFGTRAHEIRPVRAKGLRFTQGGAVVFRTRVWHPGTAPNRFVQESTRHWRP